MMSVDMDQTSEVFLQAAQQKASMESMGDVDVDPEADGSSSLSEIEDRDTHPEEDGEGSDEGSNESEEENDSEAETERLEESPNKVRAHQDVVLTSHNGIQGYERSPSKLHNQILPNDLEDEDNEDLSSLASSTTPKSSGRDDEADPDPTTAATSLGDSAAEVKRTLSIMSDTRKRKRSIMAGSTLDEDLDEPLRKRTGTIMATEDDYAIEEEGIPGNDPDGSNSTGGEISGDEVEVEPNNDETRDEEPQAVGEEPSAVGSPQLSPRKSGRKKRGAGPDTENDEELPVPGEADTMTNGDEDANMGDEDNVDNEGDDEAEAALKNEEELERKRIALEHLNVIEKQFATFRDRLHDERLEQLNREEAMLQQDKPTHPSYLAMMRCVDARRDEKIQLSERLRECELKALRTYAVARRSQILSQYQQEVREIRERKLEQLGKQWYDIQHDRRSYAGSVPDYTLKFPTRKSQQNQNQIAYSNEVSILSGVAKYVGFPAAPIMATATESELADDFEKMGRSRHVHPMSHVLPELAALRTAGSTSRFRPAEEQFIEQTPWANPQHPSHAHLLQRQTSGQPVPRMPSPFSQHQQRRHSHQSGPVSGTFSNSTPTLQPTNGGSLPTGRISPHNPFSTSHGAVVPSPLGSRQASPQQNRNPTLLPEQQNISSTQEPPKSNGLTPVATAAPPDLPRDFLQEGRREQLVSSRF